MNRTKDSGDSEMVVELSPEAFRFELSFADNWDAAPQHTNGH